LNTKAPLRIIVAVFGSSGEVHPVLGTARALQARGHEICLIAPAPHEDIARKFGFAFSPLGPRERFERFMGQEKLWQFPYCFPLLAQGAAEIIEPAFDAVLEHHQPGRTMLVSQWLVFGARIAQEVLGIPGVTIHAYPSVLRSSIAPSLTPPLPVSDAMPGWWNRACFAVADATVLDLMFAKPVNAFRAQHALPPIKRILANWIHSPDRVIGLFPDWFAPSQPDWPPQTVLTGFPLYAVGDEAPLDASLQAFLDAGEAPIAMTFGSYVRHAEQSFAAAISACRILGRRGVMITPFTQHLPQDLPADFHHTGYAPFNRLLPRCSAIIHHGGIGTIASALASGIPQVIVPGAFDQADNAARLQRLGAGLVLPSRSFTGKAAVAVLRRLASDDFVAACAAAKARLAVSSASANTVNWIERTFEERRSVTRMQ
jgi:UDP:flavonoid glycosyltransferase YjiC (YdhE family)